MFTLSPPARKRRRAVLGFTLIELIVVIVIMGILVAIGAFAYNAIVDNSRKAGSRAVAEQVAKTVQGLSAAGQLPATAFRAANVDEGKKDALEQKAEVDWEVGDTFAQVKKYDYCTAVVFSPRVGAKPTVGKTVKSDSCGPGSNTDDGTGDGTNPDGGNGDGTNPGGGLGDGGTLPSPGGGTAEGDQGPGLVATACRSAGTKQDTSTIAGATKAIVQELAVITHREGDCGYHSVNKSYTPRVAPGELLSTAYDGPLSVRVPFHVFDFTFTRNNGWASAGYAPQEDWRVVLGDEASNTVVYTAGFNDAYLAWEKDHNGDYHDSFVDTAVRYWNIPRDQIQLNANSITMTMTMEQYQQGLSTTATW